MKINPKNTRILLVLSCIFIVLTLAGCLLKPTVTPAIPDQPVFTHYRVTTQTFKEVNPDYAIEVAWRASSIDYSFQLFKSINNSTFEVYFDDGKEESASYLRKSCSCSFSDTEVTPGNTYSYYVLAYNDKGEVGQSATFTRELFLPPCILKSPQDESEIVNPFPTFDWDSKALSKYLSRSKATGYEKAHLKVKDETVLEDAWEKEFADATISSVTYNEDGTGKDLVDDHYYDWCHWVDSYDNEGNLIASGYSNSWHFHYKGPIKAVLKGQIQIPETAIPKSRDVGGTIPLVDASVTLTDSEGVTHTGTTEGQGQYIFPQVAPGTNYIITAVGEVEGQTIVYKDVVPSITLHEVFDAGIADAESTALALVMEAMLEADPNLNPEDIVLDDILNAANFPTLVTIVGDTLNAYGNVTTDPEVIDAVQAVDMTEIVSWLNQHAQAWLDYDINQIASMIAFNPFVIKNYNWDSTGNYSENDYRDYLAEKFTVLTIETFDYQNNDIHLENQNEAIVYSDKYIKYTEGNNTFDEINKIYFHLIKTETGWKADEYRVLCTVPMTRVEANLIEVNGNYEVELYWRGYTYQDYNGNWQGADVDKYRIYQRVNDGSFVHVSGTNYELVPGGNGNEFHFFDNSTSMGNDYTYYITADGGELSGESEPSKFATVIASKITGFEGNTETETDGNYSESDYMIMLYWLEFPNAISYHVYCHEGAPSSDPEEFTEIFRELEIEDGECEFEDEEVNHGTTYQYYVVAELADGTFTNPSKILTLDSWYDNFAITDLVQGSVLTVQPTEFTWEIPSDITPGSVTECQVFIVLSEDNGRDEIWEKEIDELNTNSIQYDGPDLIDGYIYEVRIEYEGMNSEGEKIAESNSETYFIYGDKIIFEYAISFACNINNLPSYSIQLGWVDYPGVSDYHVFRSTNPFSGFSEVTNDEADYGVTYYYYVEGNLPNDELVSSSTITVDTWFPIFDLYYPAHNQVITEPKPTFTWENPDITFPYLPSANQNGGVFIYVREETLDDEVWELQIDLDDDSITYNGEPLQEGHQYIWGVRYEGRNEVGFEVVHSISENRFYYGYQPFETTYRTETFAPNENSVRILWQEYPTATDYQVYKSTDGTSFDPLSGDYELHGDWYGLWDHTVNDGGIYYYYVVAFDEETEIQTGDTMEVNTWLPGIITEYPIEDEVISEDHPTFTWSYEADIGFPEGPFDFFQAGMNLYDIDDEETIWEIELNDLDVFSYVYDGPDLISGHKYIWCRYIEGMGDDGIMTATAGRGWFYYRTEVQIVRVCSDSGGGIEVCWWPFNGADYYRVYRSTDGTTFNEIFDSQNYTLDEYTGIWWNEQSLDVSYFTEWGYLVMGDNTTIIGNEYTYYVTAYDGDLTVETEPSTSVMINTWLPSSSLDSPADNEVISVQNPLLEWSPPNVSFPYGQLDSAHIDLDFANITANSEVWNYTFDNFPASSINYNFDGSGEDLIDGNVYKWRVIITGIDNDSVVSCESMAGSRTFTYQAPAD